MYASTAANIAGKNDETGLPNGRYVWSDEQNFQVYGDFMAMFNKTLGDFSINAALGTSINVSKANSLMIDSKTASLYRLMYLPFPISSSLQRDLSTRRLMRNVLYNPCSVQRK